ncbi:Hypothetical protein CAP_3706 [Chondromyces apiculatus DSM 436]|uniref:Glycine zipper domain-containing protein n=2 Tax=Chondromyces apiculatus TaxID=51 RepID=A0A017T7V8_9BACT|nr:Hypothetical protein CAP_3706 [Chondromyces apiculatus DSM 436]
MSSWGLPEREPLEPHPLPPEDVPLSEHRTSTIPTVLSEALAGVVAGAALGTVGSPPGIVVGAVVGAIVGANADVVVKRDRHERHDDRRAA